MEGRALTGAGSSEGGGRQARTRRTTKRSPEHARKNVSATDYPHPKVSDPADPPQDSGLRILPAVVTELSPEDFEEVTDLLAELILERMRDARWSRK